MESRYGASGIFMNVVSFKAARARLRAKARSVLPPSYLSGPIPAASLASATDEDEDRLRMRQNIAAMVAILAIVVIGTWLIDGLRSYSRLQTCLLAGHRNCVPIEAGFQPSPFRG
jgi:hypothetical protein